MEKDFSPIASLADALFSREVLLTKEGIQSFMPMLRWEESFCQNDTDLQEYRDVNIKFKKMEIWASEESIRTIKSLQEEGAQRTLQSGNLWDSYLSHCERRFHELRCTDLQRWINLQDFHYQEEDRLWREEVRQFNLGHADRLLTQSKRKPTAVGICKKLLEERLTEFGFQLDEELTCSPFLVYKKNITDLYKLCWTVDLVNLRKPLNLTPMAVTDVASGVKQVIQPRGIPFDIRLALTMVGAHPRDRIPVWFSFDCLFPLGGQYRHFKSFQELEALVNIYVTMYKIIGKYLESACMKAVT